MKQTIWLVFVSLIVAAMPHSGSAADERPPNLKTLLARAASYADAFESDFSAIVGEERYDQTASDTYRPIETRRLDSEVFFIGVDRRREWLTVRNVLSVDGQPVADSSTRLKQALAGEPDQAWMRLKRLADENARFNVGAIQRNFSEPTLALTFVDSRHQWRFKFSAQGPAPLEGVRLTRLAFREVERPTIIREANLRGSLPSSGSLLVADDGRVFATTLNIPFAKNGEASIHVSFAHDGRLGMLVPASMDEHYKIQDGKREVTVTGRAIYANFRRFQTSIRILPDVRAVPDR